MENFRVNLPSEISDKLHEASISARRQKHIKRIGRKPMIEYLLKEWYEGRLISPSSSSGATGEVEEGIRKQADKQAQALLRGTGSRPKIVPAVKKHDQSKQQR